LETVRSKRGGESLAANEMRFSTDSNEARFENGMSYVYHEGMNVRIGTSGFSYKEWKGPFYPEKMKPEEMLAFYASKMRTVEINNTFYRLPSASVLQSWKAEVPESFSFVLKASQRITHIQRLVDTKDLVARFFDAASALGDKLGAVLYQLPPFLKKDVPRLAAFLESLPPARAAVEFGSSTWHADEVYDLLKKHDAALCIVDDDKKNTPFVATASWGYIRMRRVEYAPADLARWRALIAEQSWKDAFVFMKHEDAGTGPRLAAELSSLFHAARPAG